MPTRLLHFEGLWSSNKLAGCAEWAQAEHAWKEMAALKQQEVPNYVRMHYHPDLGSTSGPGISERTRRANNAVG